MNFYLYNPHIAKQSDDDAGYWSNTYGWVTKEYGTVFTEKDPVDLFIAVNPHTIKILLTHPEPRINTMYFELKNNKPSRISLNHNNFTKADIYVSSEEQKQELLMFFSPIKVTVVASLECARTMHRSNLKELLVVHHSLLKGKQKIRVLKELLGLCIKQLEQYSDNELIADGPNGSVSIQAIKDYIK